MKTAIEIILEMLIHIHDMVDTPDPFPNEYTVTMHILMFLGIFVMCESLAIFIGRLYKGSTKRNKNR